MKFGQWIDWTDTAFGQWINRTDTNDTADIVSITSEDAIAQENKDGDDDRSKRSTRSIDIHEIEANTNRQKKQRVAKKLSVLERPQRRLLDKLRLLIREKIDAFFPTDNRTKIGWKMITLIVLILIVIVLGVAQTTRSKDLTICEDGDDGPFDFSDFEITESPTTIEPTSTPTGDFFDFDFDFEEITVIPSSEPSTHEHSTSNHPSKRPSQSTSLTPTTAAPTFSNYPSVVPSITPTYTPTQSLEPFALPPIVPFREEDADKILTFCVIADAPYNKKELEELPGQIATQMEGCEFLVHLGDIFVGDTPCDIKDYQAMQNIMLGSHVPGFLVPGDNEWNDCLRSNIDVGWNHWTNHFIGFENYWNHTFSIARQPGYEENFYFIEKRILIFGLNIVGGRVHNATEWKTRLRSEFAWVRSVMKLNLLDTNTTDGVILMAHAHPSQDHQHFFTPFRVFLRDELQNRFPVLYLHGDGHDFLYTPNYQNQSNFLRIQHEGGTKEPVLKIMAGPELGNGTRSNVYDAFQYDRQLELLLATET